MYTLGSREEYQTIRRRLREPEIIRFDPLWTEELPDDPLWPAPSSTAHHDDIADLLDKLPHPSSVLCAATAVEMVLPIYQRVLPEDRRVADALQAIWNWLAGAGSDIELEEAIEETEAAIWDAVETTGTTDSPQEWVAGAANQAARAARWDPLTYPAGSLGVEHWIETAVINATQAVVRDYEETMAARIGAAAVLPGTSTPALTEAILAAYQSPQRAILRFLRRWWSKCRQRLAIRGVETAEIEWHLD